MSIGEIIGTFLLLIIVGALIGGVTNFLAIKMLFRPHRAIMIGGWRLPFTPGLIPKRREDIAKQLGRLVMKHLLTAESLEKKFMDSHLKEQMTSIVQAELKKWLEDSQPLAHYLGSERQYTVKQLDAKLNDWIMQSFISLWESHQQNTLYQLLPDEIQQKISSQLPQFSQLIGQRLINYLESDEGKEKVKGELDRFFEGKGFLGSMLGMFLGNQSLMDKLYPELIRFLNQPSFIAALHELLEREWLELQHKTLKELDETIHLQEMLKNAINDKVSQLFSIETVLQQTPGELLGDVKDQLIGKVAHAVDYGLRMLAKRTVSLLEALDLEKLVTDQVRAFSIQELEEVVLMISKREFKMITYLGAFLGGVIGIVQAVVMLFI
ncbi:UPF0754 membrane protein [Pullulanibacillus camelliae]|uniref:UPF0754 membrane protein n=1 Tax=Pullulanibacillus camelliae TaxID=1707096 RepID=A0A8J2YHZ0_9BACL|nr:DUF445 family protein [Pullulanibacillus camelliae]GGE44324.1 UPF0754 membrane protein [Pullulanibacillus camelliae]